MGPLEHYLVVVNWRARSPSGVLGSFPLMPTETPKPVISSSRPGKSPV